MQAVLEKEVAVKLANHDFMRGQIARFAFHKTLDGFDWEAQPSMDPRVVTELATIRFPMVRKRGFSGRLVSPRRS